MQRFGNSWGPQTQYGTFGVEVKSSIKFRTVYTTLLWILGYPLQFKKKFTAKEEHDTSHGETILRQCARTRWRN